MQYPGNQHFIYLKHLLNHIQYFRCSGGIKFYSEMILSPIYQLMIDSGNKEYAEATIIQFTDSSFQDCPDTSRSTGGYLTFMQGAVIEAVSTMPNIIGQSTCEAEYCMASLCVMAGSYNTRLQSYWYLMHVKCPTIEDHKINMKFRLRFRMPYVEYKKLLDKVFFCGDVPTI
jgi:hypothetical protein